MDRASTEGHVYNVCTGASTEIRDLATMIAGILGVSAAITYGPRRAGEIQVSVGDPSASRHELGFATLTALQEGLARTLLAIPDPNKSLGKYKPKEQ